MMIVPTDISQISSIIKKALYFFVFLASLITCKSQYHSQPVPSCATDIPAAMLGKCIICAQREITGPLLCLVLRACLSVYGGDRGSSHLFHPPCRLLHRALAFQSLFSILHFPISLSFILRRCPQAEARRAPTKIK